MNAAVFELLESAYARGKEASEPERAALIAELKSVSIEGAEQLTAMWEAGEPDRERTAKLVAGVAEVEEPKHHEDRIDKYRLLSVIGEGGCGVVYLAEQPFPAHRLVAIKVTKPGMDSREVLARFNQERQALAMMDHPYLVTSIDAGMTASKRPYVVMPLIPGLPIHRFCDEEKLGVLDRVKLMARVCRGIEHAHAKGVIHRDIKPGNILVVRTDGEPMPRIIDFGLAKAMTEPMSPHVTMTRMGQVLGTPDYMSPEQASGPGADVRTDVYSLGAVLYELLAGRRAIDPTAKGIRTTDELRAMLTSVIPVAPSRHAKSKFRRELDWIVLKCLEKEPGRRYATVAALADDLDRFVLDKRVEAGPPAKMYRAWRWVVKRWVIVTAAVLVVAAIGTGFWQVEKERARAAQVAAVTRSILTSVDPAVARGHDTELLFMMLDESKGLFETQKLDPEVELDLRETFALANDRAGRVVEGAVHAERADELICKLEGERSARRVPMMLVRWRGLDVAGLNSLERRQHSDALRDEIIAFVTAELAPNSAEQLEALVDFTRHGELEPLQSLLERCRLHLGQNHQATIRAERAVARRLGNEHRGAGHTLAEDARRRAIETYGEDDPISHLGLTVEQLCAAQAKLPLEEQAARMRERIPAAERVLGWRNPEIAMAYQNLAEILGLLSECDEAEATLRKALDLETRARGDSTGRTQWMRGTLTVIAINCKRWDRFDEYEAELWRIEPKLPFLNLEMCSDIMRALLRRGERARFERWMTGLANDAEGAYTLEFIRKEIPAWEREFGADATPP